MSGHTSERADGRRSTPLRVCLAGTFDPNFHRNQVIRGLLEHTGYTVETCHVRLWGQREDHIVRRGRMRLVFRALLVYPLLVWRFLRMPRPDVVLIAYPGHFDVPVLAPFARWRGAPILFDTFISLFDTIVADRQLVSARSFTGRFAAWVDREACRRASLAMVDTPQSAEYFAALAQLPADRFRVLWIGAQEATFRPHPEEPLQARRVLFYGTFIPLHGVPTIVRAAKLLESEGITFRLIGSGQERPLVEALMMELGVGNVELLDPVPLAQLPVEIAQAAVCLGVFGTTEKAGRVIPNKVYQCLAVGRPVITADTPALRAAFAPSEVAAVPAGDPAALAGVIRSLLADGTRREAIARGGHARYVRDYSQEALAALLRSHLEEAWRRRPGQPPART